MGRFYTEFQAPFFLREYRKPLEFYRMGHEYSQDGHHADSCLFWDLRRRLDRLPGIDASDVEIVVSERTVQLIGSASSQEEIAFLGRLVDRTPGVRAVQNHLMVDALKVSARIANQAAATMAAKTAATAKLEDLATGSSPGDGLRIETDTTL